MKLTRGRNPVPQPGADWPRTTLVRGLPNTYEISALDGPAGVRSLVPGANGTRGSIDRQGAVALNLPDPVYQWDPTSPEGWIRSGQ